MFYGRCIWFCLFFHTCPTRTNQSSVVRLINCSRGIVAWLKVVHVCLAFCILYLGSAIICKWHYIKKINRIYDIGVNLCMGPLKWLVSFQWVLYPWYLEKFLTQARMIPSYFAPTKFGWNYFWLKKIFWCRIIYCSKRIFENLYFLKIYFFQKATIFFNGAILEMLRLCARRGSVFGWF